MGTNYYVEVEEHDAIHKKHIGKSSAGWCFGLHIYPDEGISSLDDWVDFLKSKCGWFGPPIYTDYGEKISLEELFSIITERSRNTEPGEFTPELLHENNAIIGPNGLLRRRIDRYHCVGHGEGTWDYLISNFS